MKAIQLVLVVIWVGTWFQSAQAVDWKWPWNRSGECYYDTDCGGTTAKCNSADHVCVCAHSSRMYKAVYDLQLKQCLSLVGKLCSHDCSAELETLDCVKHAECRPKLYPSEAFGLCQCVMGFEETAEHLCTRANNRSQAGSAGIWKYGQGQWALGAYFGASALLLWVLG